MHIIFDTETTGLEAGSRCIELGAQKVDASGQVVDTFCQLMNPGMPLPADAQSVNRISADDLAKAADPQQVMRDFQAFIAGADFLVAHWAIYDQGIVSWEFGRAGLELPTIPVVDTWLMAKQMGRTPNNKLATLVEYHGLKAIGEAHRALADTDTCRQLFDLAKAAGIKPQPKPWQAPHQFVVPEALPSALGKLPEAVAKGLPFSFGYTDAVGEKSERTITPYGWALMGGNVMFHGLCHLRGARREFRADRVAA